MSVVMSNGSISEATQRSEFARLVAALADAEREHEQAAHAESEARRREVQYRNAVTEARKAVAAYLEQHHPGIVEHIRGSGFGRRQPASEASSDV